MHRRNQETDLLSEFLADAADAAQQFAVLRFVDQRNQPIADFQTEHVERRHVGPARLLRFGRHHRRRRYRNRLGGTRAAVHFPRQRTEADGQQQENEIGHAGNQSEHADDRCGQPDHARIVEELGKKLLRDVLGVANARHHHARGNRDDQRRDLGHQTVADRQQRVSLGRCPDVEIVLQHTDEQSAEDVDEHNQDAGDGVAADELRRAVHRAEEIGLVGDRRAPFARFVLADQSGVEVGVDRHLLARHRIEREACGDFGDAAGALGDHDKIDDHQNRKNDDADRVVAADQEVAKSVDHLSGGARAGMAFEQHDARRGDVERQAQQRSDQQHRRKNREIERFHDVDRDQHDDHRNGDIEGKEQVEHERRQRQHHHRQDEQDQHRASQLLQAVATEKTLQGERRVSHRSAPAPTRRGRRWHAAASGNCRRPAASC